MHDEVDPSVIPISAIAKNTVTASNCDKRPPQPHAVSKYREPVRDFEEMEASDQSKLRHGELRVYLTASPSCQS